MSPEKVMTELADYIKNSYYKHVSYIQEWTGKHECDEERNGKQKPKNST
jgi:hypothetical protein